MLVGSDDPSFPRARLTTLAATGGASVADYADRTFLPAIYSVISGALHLDPTQLGIITSGRSISGALGIPFFGWLADRYSRRKLLTIGCVFWGLSMSLVGFADGFWSLFWFRSINGAGLGLVLPAALSLMADYFPARQRGRATGVLAACGVFGAGGGAYFAATLGGHTYGSMPGWRLACHCFALFALVLGGIVWVLVVDPVRGTSEDLEEYTPITGSVNAEEEDKEEEEPLISEYYVGRKDWRGKCFEALHPWVAILKSPTAVVLMVNTALYGFPFSAFNFIIYFLEYAGFSSGVAALVFGLVGVGSAMGMLTGGALGDYFARRWGYKGRLMVAQFSAVFALPFAYILVEVVPPSTNYIASYCIVCLIAAFAASWPVASTIAPLLSEITLPDSRSRGYALISVIDGSIGSLGSLAVGAMADAWFGYLEPPSNVNPQDLPLTIRDTNRIALGKSLMWTSIFCWGLQAMVLTIVYYTYPKDHQWLKDQLVAYRGRKSTIHEEGETTSGIV